MRRVASLLPVTCFRRPGNSGESNNCPAPLSLSAGTIDKSERAHFVLESARITTPVSRVRYLALPVHRFGRVSGEPQLMVRRSLDGTRCAIMSVRYAYDIANCFSFSLSAGFVRAGCHL